MMTTVMEYTREEFLMLVATDFGVNDDDYISSLTFPEIEELVKSHVATLQAINRWLARGDGVAVYENHLLGHPELGHKQFVSFGSAQAQLETPEPPRRLPDIGSAINWRYQLIGTYRGEAL